MWVKICANTTLQDAQLAAELGADAVGFVFAPSKRQVTAEQVAEITAELPGSVSKVGVFGPGEAESLVGAVRAAGLTAVQLHLPYDRGFVGALTEAFEGKVELWQVVSYDVDAGEDAERTFVVQLRAAMYDGRLSAVLLDSAKAGQTGGLGLRLPWGRIGSILRTAREASRQAGRKFGFEPPNVILAGGLNAENVQEAVTSVGPDGVDVASGVEAVPGRKDPEKLGRFLSAVRSVK